MPPQLVPALPIETVADASGGHLCVVGRDELSHAIVVHAEFRLKDSGVTGYLVMVLGVASIERLMTAIDAWIAGGAKS